MLPYYVKRHTLTDVMTTNVMKEKFKYLACTFISDHLQKRQLQLK